MWRVKSHFHFSCVHLSAPTSLLSTELALTPRLLFLIGHILLQSQNALPFSDFLMALGIQYKPPQTLLPLSKGTALSGLERPHPLQKNRHPNSLRIAWIPECKSQGALAHHWACSSRIQVLKFNRRVERDLTFRNILPASPPPCPVPTENTEILELFFFQANLPPPRTQNILTVLCGSQGHREAGMRKDGLWFLTDK